MSIKMNSITELVNKVTIKRRCNKWSNTTKIVAGEGLQAGDSTKEILMINVLEISTRANREWISIAFRRDSTTTERTGIITTISQGRLSTVRILNPFTPGQSLHLKKSKGRKGFLKLKSWTTVLILNSMET